MGASRRSGSLIDETPSRAVFTELVEGALDETRVQPTPMAAAYLVELLDDRIHVPQESGPPRGGERALCEALLRARRKRGKLRVACLRRLGDRALFVSGFFGESLEARPVGLRYYRDLGRTAYADVASNLAKVRPQGSDQGPHEQRWPLLFEELADRFREFVDVLAEVSDHTAARGPGGLLRLYTRYLQTGSSRDRRRLLRRGQVPPDLRSLRSWQ